MVHFSESFKDFLSQSESRLAQFIIRMHKYWKHHPHYGLALTSEHIDYVTLRPNGMISFMPAGKEQEYTDDGAWKREGRQEGRPSKVIRKILTKNAQKLFSDKDFESFCNQYKAACDAEQMTFEIRKDIADVYCMKRAHGDSSLNGSCMNGDRSCVRFYEHIPQCSVIAMFNTGGELAGRALLWCLEDGRKLMDRVYVAKDHYYELFLDFAKDNGFIRKVHYKSYDYRDMFVSTEGSEFYERFFIRFSSDYDRYPYIDTFQYGEDNYITNVQGDCQYQYNQTDGNREGDCEMVWDALNGEDIAIDEARFIGRGRYRDEYIPERNSVVINGYWWWEDDEDITWISGNGYMVKEDCTWIESREEWVHSDDAVYCEVEKEYEHTMDVRELADGTYTHEDNAVEIDGVYYHKNEEDEIRAGLENPVE